MDVKYHIFKDYDLDITGASDEELAANKKFAKVIRKNRYFFVSMCYHPKRKRIYVGCTQSGGDLLVEFNPKTSKFRSCGYAHSGYWYSLEAKIHKGIWLDEKEDALYFGTSTLSPVSQTVDSKGGKLIRYRIKDRQFDLIAEPTPGDFYQATGYDPKRKKIYMYTMPGSCFAVYDMKKKKLLRSDPMESIPHIGAIDHDGGVWGTYDGGTQAFFRYMPDENRYEFPEGCSFPNALAAANIMYPGAGPIDSCITGDDGYIYTGSALGELFRIDPQDKSVTYLGKPFTGKRLPGIYLADDGYIYLCGGNDGAPRLARYDRATGNFELLGIVESPDGTLCYRCHELVVVDGVAYIGETDNPKRSGYIWECSF